MSFANPSAFLLLLIIPVIILLNIFRGNQSNLNLSLASKSGLDTGLIDRIGFYLPSVLRVLVLIALIIALARPQYGQSNTSSKNLGLDIFLAVDTSQSMSALDLKLNNISVDRLTVVKEIVGDFILKRNTDRLGLVVFGERAYTQCPLTTDHGTIVDLLERSTIGMVGQSTAIGSAIAVATRRLKDLEAKSKILILMTDGQNTAGDIAPITSAKLAKELGIKIYTIGIGRDGEVPFRIPTPNGIQTLNQVFEIDEDTLTEIAEMTGGTYYRAESTNDLKSIYQEIDQLEKTEIEVKNYNSFVDVFENLLWIAFVLFIIELILGKTIFYRLNS